MSNIYSQYESSIHLTTTSKRQHDLFKRALDAPVIQADTETTGLLDNSKDKKEVYENDRGIGAIVKDF